MIGDTVRLRAALENLIDNAVKFTASGNIAFGARPCRRRQGQGTVRFTVADSGIGISVAEIKRLFRPFSQANISIAQRFGGAGLGLSSVRQLARAMGGDVTASPRKGGGTVFAMTASFPLASGVGRRRAGRRGRGARRVARRCASCRWRTIHSAASC